MGGEMTYTQSEYAAIGARRGEYQIEGEVDRSGPGEPAIRVKLAPTNAKGAMPVSGAPIAGARQQPVTG
jgi:hypothetical protein